MVAVRALERFLLPNACVACEKVTGQPDTLLCSVCRTRLRFLAAGCTRCRQPLPPVGPCRFCATWPAALTWVHSAVWLDHEARETLHHLKYGGYWCLAAVVAEIITRTVVRPPTGWLCPIPLAPARLRQRGFNQAERIAAGLARRWSLPLLPGVLRRLRETRTQTRLDPAGRRANVAGAFAATRPEAVEVSGSRVILVDDVLTTGATIAAAADALQGAGWMELGAVTFARASPFVRRALLQ